MKYKRQFPILLNYTGELVRIKLLPGIDARFKQQKGGNNRFIILPPLGRPVIKTEMIKDPEDIFPTLHYRVEGLPVPGREVFYIVHDNIARILSRHRNDLLVLCDVTVSNTENPLKAGEIYLNCTDLAHVLVRIE